MHEHPVTGRKGQRCSPPLAVVFEGCLHQSVEERCRFFRVGLELRMELGPDVVGVRGELPYLHLDAVVGDPREDPSALLYPFDEIGVPSNISIEVTIYSSAPQGCSTGTSAAVSVALIGALDALTPGRQTPGEVAVTAHRIETERLGLQSGIQDQLSSAYGGICFIEMYQYPKASVSKLDIPNALWWELESRTFLIFLGQSHESSEVHKQVIRKAAGEITVAHDPAVRLYPVKLIPPSLDHPLADLERLTERLDEAYGLTGLTTDYLVLMDLPQILREAEWDVTVAVWDNREIIRIYPGHVEEYWGLAVDIGTTTVAAYLCSLKTGMVHATESIMNPQVVYGEDIMSRISYAMTNRDTGLEELSDRIVTGLNDMITKAAATCRIKTDEILDMTVVGNTAMHHLLLRIDPQYVGAAPFAPALHRSVDVRARELGIVINPSSYVHVLPIEAGFVGADNVGVLIHQEPYRQKENQLIIDIGTNGELVLGNKERLMSASCATGPALEGAEIAFGMRAAPGAIERIKIDPKTFDVNYKAIGTETWKRDADSGGIKVKGICGSGIIDLLGELYRSGIVQKNGSFSKNLKTTRLRSGTDGTLEFVIAWKEETSIGKDVVVTQRDIRQIQLAKAAIYAGAKMMMRRMGITHLDRVVIAGAFGTHVDKEEALIIGMLPDIMLDRVVSVGNAAGDGARIALLNREKRQEADQIARQVEYMELTIEKEFQDEFVAALTLPHAKDPFPHLSGLVPDEILNQ